MAGDLHELLGEDVSLLFAREWQLRDRVFASHGWEQQRIGSLCSLAAGKAPILVATVDGLMQRTAPARRAARRGDGHFARRPL